MEELHSPEMIDEINKDLQIYITNLTLQTQTHLLRFLWEKTKEEFEEFKNALNSIQNEEDKYNFLNTFLSCSEDIWFWDVILKISKSEFISEENKAGIYQKYSDSIAKIENLSKNIFFHYEQILEKGERKTPILENKIRQKLIQYAWDLFEEINFEIDKNNNINLKSIFEKFDRFDLEMVWIFKLIESFNLDEIEKLSLNRIPNIKSCTYNWNELENSWKKEQVLSIVAKKFSFKYLEAFKSDFLKEQTSVIHTLEADWKVLYVVWSREIEIENKRVKYIDWLANSPDLEWFNLKLTQNFLENEFNFWELSSEVFEALWEPKILTSYLFIEKFWFIANWTSNTPESKNYWNPWKFLRLQKDNSNTNLSKWKSLEELMNLANSKQILLQDFSIPKDNDNLINFVEEQKQKWLVMSRMILKKRGQNDEKIYTCAFEKL